MLCTHNCLYWSSLINLWHCPCCYCGLQQQCGDIFCHSSRRAVHIWVTSCWSCEDYGWEFCPWKLFWLSLCFLCSGILYPDVFVGSLIPVHFWWSVLQAGRRASSDENIVLYNRQASNPFFYLSYLKRIMSECSEVETLSMCLLWSAKFWTFFVPQMLLGGQYKVITS